MPMCVNGGSSIIMCSRGVLHCIIRVCMGVLSWVAIGMMRYGLDCQCMPCGVTCCRTSSVAK
eukprot:11568752-Prorocentrum_lima.AAC.1